MPHQMKGDVRIDFALPAIPEVYKDPDVFLRLNTGNAGLGDGRQSLVVQIHNRGLVSQIEVMLDEYKLMWLKSWEQGNDKAMEEGLQKMIADATTEETHG